MAFVRFLLLRGAASFVFVMAAACTDGADDATVLGHCSAPSSDVPQFTLEREWEIGGVHDEELELTHLSSAAPAPRTGLSFVQREQAPVTTLNADGTLRHRVGRAGSGPGEWSPMLPPGIQWFADTLIVVDRARIHRFREDPDGQVEHLDTQRVEPPFDQPLVPLHVLRNGAVVGTLPPRVQNGGRRLVHWRKGSVDTDSVSAYLDGATYRLDLPGGGFSSVRKPILDYSRRSVVPNGRFMVILDRATVLAADSGEYRIKKLLDDGQVSWERTVCYRPRAIPEAERNDTIRAQAQRLAEPRPGAPVGEMEQRIREALELPEAWPPVTAVVTSTNGDIWLRREERASATPWEIRDEDGDLVGFVRIPSDARVLAVDQDVVWLGRTDEWDVPRISRHRLAS